MGPFPTDGQLGCFLLFTIVVLKDPPLCLCAAVKQCGTFVL